MDTKKSQMSELESLAIEAQAVDALVPDPVQALQQQEQQQAQVAAVNDAEEFFSVLQIAKAVLVGALPSLEKIYSEQRLRAIADATVPVLHKYGLSTGGLLSRFAPEIGLIVAVLPVGLETYGEIKKARAESIAAAKKQSEAPTTMVIGANQIGVPEHG